MERLRSEKLEGRLTQENQILRLVLLNLSLACGNLLRNVPCRKAERGANLSLTAANGPLPEGLALVSVSRRHPETLSRSVRGRSEKTIPGSARYEHDKKRESTGGSPPSGHKKPELPCLALFTPRGKQQEKPSGAVSNTENQSWNCACS
jgi:hypothetical protein